MKSIRAILALGAILGFASASAIGETYYFDQVPEGDWNDPENWRPDGGPPGADDTAIIVDGHTCLVEEAHQEAHEVEVEEGATLGIVSKDLTIGEGPETIHHLTVDGTLYFKTTIGPGAPTPRLLSPDNHLYIHGSGVVTARRADGYGPGRIEGLVLSVFSGATLAGSLQIYTDGGMQAEGTFVVDGSTDDMYVGRLSSSGSRPWLDGSGSFRASNGTMHFGRVWLSRRLLTAYWEVSDNGEMHVSEYVLQLGGQSGYPRILVQVSGGRLYVNTHFMNRRGLYFSGGEIEVGAGKFAEFNYIVE